MTIDGLTGVWTLSSHVAETIETGERTEPFGPHPRGVLMLHPDGRMAGIITARDRPAPAAEAERAAAFGQMLAYSGRYRLEAPDRMITAVDIAWYQPWVGTEQARTYRLDGDTLQLITPPGRMPRPDGTQVTVVSTLTWVREGAGQ